MAPDTAVVIKAQSPFVALAARLTPKAEVIANARRATAATKRRDEAAHWRNASLVWPLFGQG